MTNTGKAVVRADASAVRVGDDDLPGEGSIDSGVFEGDIVAAAAFNPDRTDEGTLWIRYLTVHEDYRRQGIGARLAAFVAERAEDRGYHRCRIAVNNAFAYHALYKAGFVYTGRQTGIAELVLERPGYRDGATYQCGLDVFRDRENGADEEGFLAARDEADPPGLVEPSIEGRGGPPDSGA